MLIHVLIGRSRTLALLVVLASSTAVAQRVGTRESSKPLDRANLDTTCAPCKDFYQFANGHWVSSHTIPPDKAGLGAFGMLGDKNQLTVQAIVDDDAKLVRGGETKPGSNEFKVGTFYNVVHGHRDHGARRIPADRGPVEVLRFAQDD